jgi:hypothetical protein
VRSMLKNVAPHPKWLWTRDQRWKSMSDQGKHRSNSCDDSSDADDKRADFP